MLKIALKLDPERFVSWKPRVKIVSTFFAGQGAVQCVNVLSGILLIHWLPVEGYAQYSMAFAFQSTAQTLVELGFSGAVIALVGQRIHEKGTVGAYIKAGKYFRNRLFIIVGFLVVLAFLWFSNRHGWPPGTSLLLLATILFNLFSSGFSAYYMAPLKMHRQLNDLYMVQVKSGVARLGVLGLLAVVSQLNAWLASAAASLSVWYNGYAFKKKAAPFVHEPPGLNEVAKKEMLRYVRPVIPGIIYSAFSSQIALFIISVFGKAGGIAELGALGRIGQLFLILNAAGSTLIAPFLARQPLELVRKEYAKVLSAVVILAILITSAAFFFPQLFIWIIGDKYAHLEKETGLLILNSSITLVNVLMWDMNCSRKWLWPWIPVVSISTSVVAQIIMVLAMDLSTTYNVLVFSIVLSCVNLFNKVLVAFKGLNKLKA